MPNPFDSKLVKDIHTMLNEQTPSSKTLPIPNGKRVRDLDYSMDSNDPTVQLVGFGSMRLSLLRKDIMRDLERLGNAVGATDAKNLMAIMSDFDGRTRSGNLAAWKMAALAEIEAFLATPAAKRKVSLIKQNRTGG